MSIPETHHDLAEAAFQTLAAFPDAEVSLPCDPCAAAAIWTARLWGDRDGWACLYLGHGGHHPKGSAGYTFTRFQERWFRWPDQRGRLLQLALTSGPEVDVYAGCLLRATRSRRAGNALAGLVAWADVDGPWTPQRQAALDRLNGLPVWQVASGDQGRHVYVRLGVEPEPPERIEGWNRRIGALLDADAGWSETKILRLPGTFNHKPLHGRRLPVPVRAAMSDPRDQLDALLPPDPGAGRTEPLPAIPTSTVPADLPRHLRDRLEEAPGADRSAQTAGLVAAAVEWGLDDGQVVALALAHRPTREKYGKRVEREATRLIGKSRPDHQHIGRPCDRAGCPNTPRWMTGPPADPVPTREGSDEPQEGALVDLLAGLRDGAWLDAQHFPPLAYAVPGLIPEGSVLLVGPPKIGKSWLVLTVALAAAAGGKALSITIPKRPVLYLALEDGDRRLQDRCRKLLRATRSPASSSTCCGRSRAA